MNVTGADLLEQLDWHWGFQMRPRMDGLTDDEYFFEPAPNCWTLHVKDGVATADFSWPTPTPSPFTTIAWRLGHMISMFVTRENHHFGDKTASMENFVFAPSAAEALDDIDVAYDAWKKGVLSANDEFLLAKSDGPPGTMDGQFPFWSVVLHLNREQIHHGAEVALLRDLYAATR